MGGGIEQLLMVAIVLFMPNTRHHTIFLEEPESHLHAGAQRYLMEKLRDGNRQVFITTHSPTFINAIEPFSLYQVVNSIRRTKIKKCDASTLDEVLEDIGVRNSDVLLSNAVVFVEGQSDRDVLNILSEKLKMSVAKKNVNILLMHGGRYAHRTATIRSELLEEISLKAPVPHLFLLDRDERSEKEIRDLQSKLQDRVYVLKARELENYLLVPRSILCALKAKYADNPPMLKRINSTTEDQIAQVITETAEMLYSIVLIKRIRMEIGGLRDSLLPSSSLSDLLAKIKNPDLAQCVLNVIKSEFELYLSGIDIEALVTKQRQELDEL
jgi:predicted ATP-dependent endonuclease of OLD family